MKKNKMIIQKENGFTILEVLISVVILAIGLLGIAAMQLNAIQGNSYGMALTEASNLVEDRIEQLKALPYATFMTELAALPKHSSSENDDTTTIIEEEDAEGFTRTTVVQQDAPLEGAFSINVEVEWESKGKTHQISYQTIITG